MKEILNEAEKNHYAIACMNTPNVETLRAVIGAAEEVDVPVIIDHAEVHNSLIPIENIGPHMVEYAKKARVPVCVHLDHGVSYNFVMKAIRSGFSSIMYDCSALPFQENVKRLKEFTKIAHDLDITVEGELGVMSSTEEDSHGGKPLTREEIKKSFTDPQEAAKFAMETGVDALAVCFGTMHGIYAEEPLLDIDRVKAIRAAMPRDCRVVMHGGSGVDPNQIKQAIDAGCSKINYYSYMAQAATKHVSEKIQETDGKIPYHELAEDACYFMKDYAKEILTIFKNNK